MSMLYKGKTIGEMTPEERKITLIIMGIMILIAVLVGIYYLFKSKKDK